MSAPQLCPSGAVWKRQGSSASKLHHHLLFPLIAMVTLDVRPGMYALEMI